MPPLQHSHLALAWDGWRHKQYTLTGSAGPQKHSLSPKLQITSLHAEQGWLPCTAVAQEYPAHALTPRIFLLIFASSINQHREMLAHAVCQIGTVLNAICKCICQILNGCMLSCCAHTKHQDHMTYHFLCMQVRA